MHHYKAMSKVVVQISVSLQIAQNMQGRGICQEPMHIHVYAFALNAIRRTLN